MRPLILLLVLGAGCARPPKPEPAAPHDAGASRPAEEWPRHTFDITIHHGRPGTGSFSRATQPPGSADSYTYSFVRNPKLGDGPSGEVAGRFLRRDGDRDVWEFTYRYPADAPADQTKRRELTYLAESLTLFETPDHTVVIGPPGS